MSEEDKQKKKVYIMNTKKNIEKTDLSTDLTDPSFC